jgi:hypothetical protein
MIEPKNNSPKKRDANDVLNDDGAAELRRQFDVNRAPPQKTTTLPPEDREYSYTAGATDVALRIHGDSPPANAKHAAAKDAGATGPQASRSGANDPPHPPHNRRFTNALELSDFYAHMPSGQFIFAPARDLWPARSIDARIGPVTISHDKEGAPVTIKASTWISKNRPVEQMTWAPGKPELIKDSLVTEGGFIRQPGRKVFNLYRSPTLNHCDAKLAGLWLEHLKRVYPNDWRHILNWFAHRVQRAGEKINHALVLGGAPGIGKDTLLHPVVQAVGPWNVNEVAPCQLMGSFNGYLKSVMLRVSEAHDLGDVDRYALHERTKTLLAAPPEMLRVNEKHLREYTVPNVVGVIYTTNHRTDSLYLPADDRRHYVAWSEVAKEDFDQKYWDTLWAWYADSGSGHVAAYLASHDLGGFSATAPPPKTPAFWSMVHADRSSDEAELADVIDALGKPIAFCLSHIVNKAEVMPMVALAEGLKDRKYRRAIPHRLERAGYISVDSDTQDGHWVIDDSRQRIYARKDLGPGDRKTAAEMLRNFGGSLAKLAEWASARNLHLGPHR